MQAVNYMSNILNLYFQVDGETKEPAAKKETSEEELPKFPAVNIGVEQIRKVEVQYCDLCRIYLARGDEAAMEKIIARHCKQLTHMQRYIRYKEDKEIEKRAQRLQRKEAAERKAKAEAEAGATKKEDGAEGEKKEDEEETVDDKLWADVDKDLGDILAEADEEEGAGERYDRLGAAEKKDEAKDTGDSAAVEVKDGPESAPAGN